MSIVKFQLRTTSPAREKAPREVLFRLSCQMTAAFGESVAGIQKAFELFLELANRKAKRCTVHVMREIPSLAARQIM